jgi:hypothetical protein
MVTTTAETINAKNPKRKKSAKAPTSFCPGFPQSSCIAFPQTSCARSGAFDAPLLGAVLRIFTETVATWYRKRAAKQCGTTNSECGGITVIQRASSDLRLNLHFHTLFLDGVYLRIAADENASPVFHAAPPPTQDDLQVVVQQAAKSIVRFLQKRGLIALATAPGDGRFTVVVGDGILCDDDPLLAQLLAAATRVHGNDKQGREHICRYITALASKPLGPQQHLSEWITIIDTKQTRHYSYPDG